MKAPGLISIFTFFLLNVQAQESTAITGSFTYGEFKGGYGISQFQEGLSERFETGNFSSSGGGLASIGAYRKFSKLNYVNLGLRFKGLGGAPSQGEQGQEMFFNFWGTAISIKAFPFNPDTKKGLYLQTDYNFVTQFTQKYRSSANLQFDHQFAIGSSFAFGLGYQYALKNGYGLVASIEYDIANRAGEVQNVGNQNFKNTNFAFQIGVIF